MTSLARCVVRLVVTPVGELEARWKTWFRRDPRLVDPVFSPPEWLKPILRPEEVSEGKSPSPYEIHLRALVLLATALGSFSLYDGCDLPTDKELQAWEREFDL